METAAVETAAVETTAVETTETAVVETTETAVVKEVTMPMIHCVVPPEVMLPPAWMLAPTPHARIAAEERRIAATKAKARVAVATAYTAR